MSAWLPAGSWLRTSTGTQLRGDLLAGITLAAYLLPAALGDASLANLPPQAGLYACLFSGLVFWLFCSSRQTAITVTSSISLLVGSSLGAIAHGDTTRFATLAAATALLTGLLAFIAHVVRAGVLVEFISETVLVGFRIGIALVLISTQVPPLLGFAGSHGGFIERCIHLASHLGEANALAAALGLTALGLLVAGRHWLPHRPLALLVVIAGIAVAWWFDLARAGVVTLGVVPQGLPPLALFPAGFSDLDELVPLAMACFLLAAVESAAIGRMSASRDGTRFDANQEFLALAAANTAAGLGQGLPVGGGMSQSLVNQAGGARSPLSGLFSSLIILVVVVTCAGALRDLPQPVLAAIVLVAVGGLIQRDALLRLWRFDRSEFVIVALVVLTVLASGILRGVLVGVVVSLLVLLRRAARPRLAELGRVPGTSAFADRTRHPENLPEAGVRVLRLEGALVYFNARHVHDRLLETVAADGGVRLLVLYLGMTAAVDLAGAEMLGELHDELERRGIGLRLAEVHGGIRDVLRRSGFTSRCGAVEQNQTVAGVLAAWQRAAASVPT